MTNTLNQIFFFLHQNQNIFFSNIGNQNIFLEKKNITKLNGPSLIQVRYIIIETKECARIGYNEFLFPYSFSGDGLGATHLGLHLSTHAEKETRYIISNTGRFLCFNSTVPYT